MQEQHNLDYTFLGNLDQAHKDTSLFTDPVSADVLKDKYMLKSEILPTQMMHRVCTGVYANDSWIHKSLAHDAMVAGVWMPGGRILAGAGTTKWVTLMNCYVSGEIDDSMEGIMEMNKQAAMTLQQGGGIGYDFSPIRPAGAFLKRLGDGAVSSGVVSFMRVFDAMCATVKSAGSRRGAMMGTLRCDHPDIEDFVTAKTEKGMLTQFNVSVLVTDKFMKAVAEDGEWHLVHKSPPVDHETKHYEKDRGLYTWKTIKARDLWDLIIRTTFMYAEPGVIFIDRVNKMNNLKYCELISATNPCGEQPLPPYGTCNLGAVNLARMVKNPFKSTCLFDFKMLREAVAVGIRFLDNVIDVTNYPLEKQREEEMAKRRLGLGITGLADCLAALGLHYGTPKARDMAKTIMVIIKEVAYQTSALLAKERGTFPLYNATEMLRAPFIKELSESTQELIRTWGLRNGVLLTIAPTGTTSTAYGNVSSGLEPIFATSYDRAVLQPDNTSKLYPCVDYGLRLFRNVIGTQMAAAPECMPTAMQLSVTEHLLMLATIQEHVDAAISKTINCPPDMNFEDFQAVYTDAYAHGCKGCTTYRPSGVRGAVLTDTSSGTHGAAPAEKTTSEKSCATKLPQNGHWSPELRNRPDYLEGRTYKLKWQHYDSAIYLTINDHDGSPHEIFLQSKNAGMQEINIVLTRLMSGLMRQGSDIEWIIEELKEVHSMNGAWIKGRFYPSVYALIAEQIEHHINTPPGGYQQDEDADDLSDYTGTLSTGSEPLELDVGGFVNGLLCSKCGVTAVVKQEGCSKCLACGSSSCG